MSIAKEVYRSGLTVEFTSKTVTFGSSDEVELDAVVTNLGPNEATISLDVWESPVLAIEVLTVPDLKAMPTIPPPVPPLQPRTVSLAAHTQRTFHWRLNVFSPPLPPGSYRIYLRDQTLPQSAFIFTVR